MGKKPSGERHCLSSLGGPVLLSVGVVAVPTVVGMVVGPELPGSLKNVARFN